jgi:hypothetical protein
MKATSKATTSASGKKRNKGDDCLGAPGAAGIFKDTV